MRILILGGGRFVGRLCVMEAVARGHHVTVLNRGSQPPVCDQATALVGDRLAQGGHSALEGLSFDAVIDTWSGDAGAVRGAVDALRGRIGCYVFVSTVSVYDTDHAPRPVGEATPLLDPALVRETNRYAADKVASEAEARKSGVPTLLARSGVILGPHESVPGRLPWWLRRMARGGPTLVPGPRHLSLQFIDGRDLARFLLDAAEKKMDGAVNLVSEPGHTTIGDLFETANEVAGGRAQLMWLDSDEVLRAGLKPWSELPLWIPPLESGQDHFVFSNDVSLAHSMGLRIRPAAQTISDTWSWLQACGDEAQEPPASVGLSPDREARVLSEHFDCVK
jgi:2'-hydroxyisoflavone reductase